MIRVVKLLVKKINHEPSVEDMKEFGLKFSRTEWDYLCRHNEFISIVDKNISKANKIADKILNK